MTGKAGLEAVQMLRKALDEQPEVRNKFFAWRHHQRFRPMSSVLVYLLDKRDRGK